MFPTVYATIPLYAFPSAFLTILPGKIYLLIKAQLNILSLVSFPTSLASNSMHVSLTRNAVCSLLFISPQNLKGGTRDALESHFWTRLTNHLYTVLLPPLK